MRPTTAASAGDHFVKKPDGTLYVAPVWPGPRSSPISRAASRARGGAALYKDFVADGFAGLLERHERAGDLRNADQDHAARQPSTASRATISRRARPATPRSTTSTAWRIRAATFEGMERLRPERPPVRDDPRELCRRPALCRHLDRRQQLDLGSSAAVGAADAQPRPVGLCL